MTESTCVSSSVSVWPGPRRRDDVELADAFDRVLERVHRRGDLRVVHERLGEPRDARAGENVAEQHRARAGRRCA